MPRPDSENDQDSSTAIPSGPSRRSTFRLLGSAAVGALLLDAGGVLGGGSAAAASGSLGSSGAVPPLPPGTTLVPQAGPVPVVIDQTLARDNVTVLLGTSAAHPSDMVVAAADEGRKNFYLQNFMSADDSLTWQVSVAKGAPYRVTGFLAAQPNQQLTVAVNGAPSATTVTTPGGVTWQRIDFGVHVLHPGTSTLSLTRGGAFYGDVYIKSLELVRQSEVAARDARIAAARADTTWFGKCAYGLMFQYGSWGFPNNVGTAKSLDQQANEFDVARFVKMVQDTGASYVVWSFSWWGFHANAPISSIDAIVTASGGPADPGLTSSRDLIGDVATACQAAGIKFLMYYHTGDEDGAWWPYQKFPRSFSADGSGDRSTFLANWQRVVSEIGTRYGTKLDGFFFDDGIIYYPAPFEQLEAAARAGNPRRLVSWNGSVTGGVPVTEFQDVWFGEGSHGEITTGSAAAGGSGVFASGPMKGLQQHGMFTMDDDWGVHTEGAAIGRDWSVFSASAIDWATGAAARRVPISFDLMMYEDGSVADRDLNILNDVRQAVHGTAPSVVPTGTTTVDDADPAIAYTGSWTHSTARGRGDVGDDVHSTATNGDSFSYTFDGTGVDVLGPKSPAGGRFNVVVDGAPIGTFSQNAPRGYAAQAVLYSARHLSPGSHTIQLTKVDGGQLQLDALRVVPNPTTLNDTDPAVAYTGAWTHSGHRGAGDFGDDVHWTATDGDSVTVSFTGTGIDVLGPMSGVDGTADVALDGVRVAATQAAYGGSYSPQQAVYSARYLKPGPHTVKLTKTSGSYVQVDAFRIWP